MLPALQHQCRYPAERAQDVAAHRRLVARLACVATQTRALVPPASLHDSTSQSFYVMPSSWGLIRRMCPRQDAAALGVPDLLPVADQPGVEQRKCKGGACSPVVSLAAPLVLDSPLSSIKVDVADGGLEVSAVAAAPGMPPPPEALPAERAPGSGPMPRRSSLTARRRSITVLPPLAEEELASPRRRQSMAASASPAPRYAAGLPRRHSSVCTAESALNDSALARYVPAEPHGSPSHEELALRETLCPKPRVSLKRAPASPRCGGARGAGEDDSMRSALKDFGRPATPDDHRRRRMLKKELTSKAGAGPLARNAGNLDTAIATASGALP